jgi:hypothetical protein
MGNSRVKTAVDRLVEAIVYGGGGALLGFCLGVVIVAPIVRWDVFGVSLGLTPFLTLFGSLLGLLGGEAGVNWIGRQIRERQKP